MMICPPCEVLDFPGVFQVLRLLHLVATGETDARPPFFFVENFERVEGRVGYRVRYFSVSAPLLLRDTWIFDSLYAG